MGLPGKGPISRGMGGDGWRWAQLRGEGGCILTWSCCWLCPGALPVWPRLSWDARQEHMLTQAQTHTQTCTVTPTCCPRHARMCAPTRMCPYRHAHTVVTRTRTDTCRQPFARVHAGAPRTYTPMRCPARVCVCARSCEQCLNAHAERCTCKHAHTRVGSAPCRGTGTHPAPRQGTGDVGVLTSPPLRHRPDRERGVRDPAPTTPTSPQFPSCAKTPKQLLAAIEASPPRGPSHGDPALHVSSHSSVPLRPPSLARRLLPGFRWELPSASSPQAVPGTWLARAGRGALWGDPQLQPGCKGLGEMLRLRAGTGLSRTGGMSRAGGWRGKEISCILDIRKNFWISGKI